MEIQPKSIIRAIEKIKPTKEMSPAKKIENVDDVQPSSRSVGAKDMHEWLTIMKHIENELDNHEEEIVKKYNDGDYNPMSELIAKELLGGFDK